MTRAIDAIMSQYWAITPDALQKISRIALRQNDAEAWQIESLKQGKPVAYTHKATVHDGVAVIPITGPVFPKANMMTEMSGATSLQKVSHDLSVALEDPSIHSIILDIDSPGGVAFGPAELAEQVKAASEKKPVIAYVAGLACSAAYMIACGASEIVAHRSALLGSIGVVTTMSVQEEPDANGEIHVEIVSSNAENKRPDPRTDAGKAEVLKELNELEEQFFEGITALRGTAREKILQDFGKGGVMIAARAVTVGMADRLGSFEDVLSDLINRSRSPATAKGSTTMQTNQTNNATPNHPPAPTFTHTQEQVAASRNEGYAAGAADERQRILGIQEISLPGHEALVKAAIDDGKSSAADVALAMAKAEKGRGQTYLNALHNDAEAAPRTGASLDHPAPRAAAADPDAPVEEQAQSEWDNDPKLRKEFGSFNEYKAFRKAQSEGRVKIKGK